MLKKNLPLEPNKECKYCIYFEAVEEEPFLGKRDTYYCMYYEEPLIIDGYYWVKTKCPKFERGE